MFGYEGRDGDRHRNPTVVEAADDALHRLVAEKSPDESFTLDDIIEGMAERGAPVTTRGQMELLLRYLVEDGILDCQPERYSRKPDKQETD